MPETLQYRPRTEEAEQKQQNYFILSQNGFGGKKYRLTKRYLKSRRDTAASWSTYRIDNCYITKVVISGMAGNLDKIIVRIGDKKVRLATFQPSDETDFNSFLITRNEAKDNITLASLETTSLSPVEYAISLITEIISQETRIKTPAEKANQLINELSFFPTQNSQVITERLENSAAAGRVFRIGCFACLNMKCFPYQDRPVYFVGQEENRLETPKISRRTIEVLKRLEETGLKFTWDFLLADTDPLDIYGEWLGQQELAKEIGRYKSRLEKTIASLSPYSSIKPWSNVQDMFSEKYQTDFQRAFETCDQLVGTEYIASSARRRLAYFTDKVGLPYSDEINKICETTAKRNIALYAAQGPILYDSYDLLVIADPDPQRLGKIQSLLCPKLPIWYPFPG